MFPESVSVRQRGSYDFESCYDNLCALQSTAPIQFVKAHIKNGLLDINGDKVRMIDWSPILNTIKINKSLRCIAIRSYFKTANGPGKRPHYFQRRTPAIRSKDVTLWISRSLAACVASSSAIQCLDLQGVPLREKDIHVLAKGIEKNCSLTHILFNYCQISDNGAKILCHAIKNHVSVTHFSLSGCNITSSGADAISRLIKHQATHRHSEAWADSLRYRTPNLGCMGGIRRVTLNSNPMIGDEGVSSFTEALKDDLWLKALDLQHCGVTTEGALSLLATVQNNNTIVVLDVRRNPMIDSKTLRSLLGRVIMNASERDENDFPWIKEETPKDPYKTRRYRPPRHFNRSFGKKSMTNKIGRKISQSEGIPEVYPPGHKSFVPWRTAVRASHHKYGFSNEDGSDDEESAIICLQDDVTVESKTSYTSGDSDSCPQSPVKDESHLSLKDSHTYIKHLKVDLIDTRRRLKASSANEKRLNDKIMQLEVENARLRKEIKEGFENSRLKSQIEDDMLLDSIEQSFNKFHGFLNMLNDVGLGSLASAAGLDGQFMLSRDKKTNNLSTPSKVTKKTENHTLPLETPILIQGGMADSSAKPKDSSTKSDKAPSQTHTDTEESKTEQKTQEKEGDSAPADDISNGKVIPQPDFASDSDSSSF